MILRNHKRQHLFFGLAATNLWKKRENHAKNSALNLRGISASRKSVLFSMLMHYAVLGITRCVPNETPENSV